ncbi:hypothetical protein KSS87_023551, partial [Heliosperma pusillum]
ALLEPQNAIFEDVSSDMSCHNRNDVEVEVEVVNLDDDECLDHESNPAVDKEIEFKQGNRLAGDAGEIECKEKCESLEDASNELILTDEEVVRFQTGEVFGHVLIDDVVTRLEETKESSSKTKESSSRILEKLEEKESIIFTDGRVEENSVCHVWRFHQP